jgi:hypothetical protein
MTERLKQHSNALAQKSSYGPAKAQRWNDTGRQATVACPPYRILFMTPNNTGCSPGGM